MEIQEIKLKQLDVKAFLEAMVQHIAEAAELPWPLLKKLAKRITSEIPDVVSVTYNITSQTPSCIEAI